MPHIRVFCLLGVLAARAPAQIPSPPADSTLARITSRGRQLLAYDIAAWHAGDALAALHPAPGELGVAIARRTELDRWQVDYGRLNEAKDSFLVVYRATPVGDSQYNVVRLPIPLADRGSLRERALAIETAVKDFGKVTRPYNTYVFPGSASSNWVYLLPAQTDARSFPLSGDVRYRIVNGTEIVDKVRFHKTVLDRELPPTNGGNQPVALVHTSFDSLPSESDVFVVLRRLPHLPEIVATKNFTYEIAVDGTISWTRVGKYRDAAPQSGPHIRVWKAVIDTVGSAPRILSPGYTEWRDTTTGWRMSLERTVPIVGADSGSWNPAWRSLMLADGRVLVTGAHPATIQLYDAEGRFERAIGRQGSGPHDYLSPPTLAMNGDTLIAFDGMQSRMQLWKLDGHFIGSFQVPVRGSPIPIAVDRRGYVRVRERYGMGIDSLSRVQWVYYTMHGVAVDSIARPPIPAPKAWRLLEGTRSMSFQVPMSPNESDAFLPDGTLIYGSGGSFELIATRTGHDTVRVFGRSDIKPVPIPAAFADTALQELTAIQPALAQVARRSDFPANYPLWNSFAADDLGFLWVATGMRGRTPVAFTIFGPDGRFLGQVFPWFDRFDGASFAGDHVAYIGYDRQRRALLRIYRVDRRGMQGMPVTAH